MLSKSSRKRIRERKMLKHSNPSQFLKRIREQSKTCIDDLTLIVENLEPNQIEDIITAENIEPFIIAMLKSKDRRTAVIMEMLANRIFQKLMGELPISIVNELGSDIGKTWTYSKLVVELWDKSSEEEKVV